MMYKPHILITDDSEMNRAILAEMLGDKYHIIEAEDGRAAIDIIEKNKDIDLLLLDINMPEVDGFTVLQTMNEKHWIDKIPVVMISSESSVSIVEKAYNLGATDYISRPFDMAIVRRRVENTIMLYIKQKRLQYMVEEQIRRNEENKTMLIDILSHIVEFRNGESGKHVINIRTATNLLLRQLAKLTDKYKLTAADISQISTASALHDIGKISIPEEILNKPGRLTNEEFDIMKTHTVIGADILKRLPAYETSDFVKLAHDICRWHHERYDGHGYPDGLKGDEIPIAAQVVALADVYDALTSDRCYKKAYDHDTAIRMILNGECGVFSPVLMECLEKVGDRLKAEMNDESPDRNYESEAHMIADRIIQEDEALVKSEHTENFDFCGGGYAFADPGMLL